MKIFIDLDETRDFYSKYDPERKIKFVLGPIDTLTFSNLFEHYQNERKESKVYFGPMNRDFVRLSLKDIQGGKIPFETQEVDIPTVGKVKAVRDKILKSIASAVFLELYGEIMNYNQLSDEEIKKSNAPTPSVKTQVS